MPEIQLDPLNAVFALLGTFVSILISYFISSIAYKSSNDLVLYQILAESKRDLEQALYKYATSQSELDNDFKIIKMESFCNALELLCKYYIENKIDRKTFKDIYKTNITIINKEPFIKMYDHLSPYQNTIIVYKHMHQNYPLPRRLL